MAAAVVLNQILKIFEDSSSDSDEEFFAVANLHEYDVPQTRIQNYIEHVVPGYTDLQFRQHFRMQRHTFQHILQLLGPEITTNTIKPGRPSICAEKQLLLSLWILGTPDSYRSVCDRFNVGKATAIKSVRRVVRVLCRRVNTFIKWPTNEEMERSIRAFQAIRGFPNVIGAIDGTHISITAPKEHPEAYVNRKGFHSVQLQAVCNEAGVFIHCFTGHPGSVHDQRVFRNSEVAQYLNSLVKFPGDVHLLGDAAYTLHNHLMVPYKDNGHLTAQQRNYNYRHSSTRMVIERAFGLLKGRMRRLLDNLPMSRLDLIPKYIIACCVLHNICLLQRDEFQPLAIALLNDRINQNEEAEIENRPNRELATRKRDLIAAQLPLN